MIRILFVFLCLLSGLEAVEGNHYILGINGLKSAVKPDKGFIYSNIFNYYRAGKLIGNDGDPLPIHGTFYEHIDVNTFAYNSGRKIFCANYGCQILIPFLNHSAEVTILNQVLTLKNNSLLLSDIYVEPINLTWKLRQMYIVAAYGFYAPTGKFRPFATNNTGLGNWGQQLTLASTYFFDKKQTWSLSAYGTYEFHSKKRGTDIYPGQNLCIDWGFGKTFFEILSVGVVGYAEWQTTNSHGSGVPFFIRGLKDRTFAVGPEVNLIIPLLKEKLALDFIFRWDHEFGVKNRTRGDSFFFIGSVIF